CADCAVTIEKALTNTRGVLNSSVNFVTGKAILEYEPKTVDIRKILKVIENAGCMAEEFKQGDATEDREIKGEMRLLVLSFSLTVPILIIELFLEFIGKNFLLLETFKKYWSIIPHRSRIFPQYWKKGAIWLTWFN
ncbi:MAG: cation transporter, partial [Thermoproteota archaeon]